MSILRASIIILLLEVTVVISAVVGCYLVMIARPRIQLVVYGSCVLRDILCVA